MCDVCSISGSAVCILNQVYKGKSLLVALIFKVATCPLCLAVGWRNHSMLYSLRRGHPTCRLESKWCKHLNKAWIKKKSLLLFCNWEGNESIHYNIVYIPVANIFFSIISARFPRWKTVCHKGICCFQTWIRTFSLYF